MSVSAKGALSLQALGNAPGIVNPKTPALKARFTFGASLAHDCRHAPITQ